MPQPRFTLDHLHVKSINPSEISTFFVDLFGAEPLGSVLRDGKVRLSLQLDNLLILVDEIRATDQAPSDVGYHHIAVAVSGHEAAMAHLRSKGARIVVEPYAPKPGILAAFVAGPHKLVGEILDRNGV